MSTEQVALYSANTHIIPADTNILQILKRVRKDDYIEMNGYLVSVEFDPKQELWTSSLTRKDTGNRSCEIFYVENIKIN